MASFGFRSDRCALPSLLPSPPGVSSRMERSLINQSRRSLALSRTANSFCINRRASSFLPLPGTQDQNLGRICNLNGFRSYLLLLRSQPRDAALGQSQNPGAGTPPPRFPSQPPADPPPRGSPQPAASPVVSGRRRLAVPYLAALLVAQVSALHVETPLGTTAGPVGNRPESFPAGSAHPTREIRAAAARSPPPEDSTNPTADALSSYSQSECTSSTSAPVIPPLRIMGSTNDFFPRLHPFSEASSNPETQRLLGVVVF